MAKAKRNRLPDAVKGARPSLAGTLPRPHLEARLARIVAPAKWLAAPSGTGKSTLVASYARGTGRLVIWYRLDSRDDDPAYFYGQLSSTLAAAVGKSIALPHYTAEHRDREERFAEGFAAALHAACGKPAMLVIDDAHKASDPARLQALAQIVDFADTQLELVFISEDAPPPAFFDAIATRRLALCNDLRLEFEPRECGQLADGLRLAHPDGETLAALTGGHAAALVLACELLRTAGSVRMDGHPVIDQVHLHLLDRILAGTSAPRRTLLERTAFVPQITPSLATDLAGADAASELDSLATRGLLRKITSGGEAIYEAHGLVRKGIQTLLRNGHDSAVVQETAIASANALIRHGALEDAFALLIARDVPEKAATVLESLAERYARRGQAALLTRSLSQLPAGLAERSPWLCFWAGQTLLGVDEELARGWFEKSYAGFERTADRAGMRLAAACVVTAFGLEYGDIRSLDAWLERHVHSGGDDAVPVGCVHEASLWLGVVCAAIFRGAFPDSFDTLTLTSRLRVLIDEPSAWLTPDQPVVAARLLIDHARIFMTGEEARAMVVATRTHAERDGTSALQRGRWWVSAALALAEDAKHEAAEKFRAKARALVEQTGSRRLAFELGMCEVDAAAKLKDLDTAASRLAQLEEIAIAAPPAHRAEHARFTARVLLLQGHPREGLRWAETALATAELAGYSAGNMRMFQLEGINALAANDRIMEAITLNRALLKGLEGRQRDGALTIEAALQYLGHQEEGLEPLRRAMALAVDTGFIFLLSRAPKAIARLCERALANDIEPDFARRIIAAQKLLPPEGAGPAWPWPVRVRTLGGFELEISGVRYVPSHKAQDRPLELLKLLVTAQVLGRDSVDKTWAAERLWPDADTTNGRKSLDMAISRLRRLLSDDAALQTPAGRLQLSPRHVWTDVAPLLRAFARVGARRDEHASGHAPPAAAAAADVAAILELHRGPFLPGEDPPPWLIAGREAVAAAVRAALLTADTLLDGRADARLIPALERAFAADSTSEDLARALMRSHLRQGRSAEALVVYRRIREMLSIVLGVSPAPETERLKEQTYAAAAASPAAQDARVRSRGAPGPR